MYELKSDPFYGVLAACPDCAVDYCLIKDEAPYRGEPSHREALAFAMDRLSGDPDGPSWTYDADRAAAKAADAAAFLAPPEKPWKTALTRKDGTAATAYDKRTDGGPIPYWEAFFLPPRGRCTAEQFAAVNAALFPAGTAELEVRVWSDDWSDYFDDGKEWWGTLCATVYDKKLRRFAVILAAATD
jgi:hypothetical protein